MAKRAISVFGCDHRDVKFAETASGSSANMSLVATAGSGSYSPPSGAERWLRIEGGGSGATAPAAAGNDDYAALGTTGLVYLGGSAFIVGNWMAAGEKVELYQWNLDIGGVTTSHVLRAHYEASGTFKLKIVRNPGGAETVIATSSNAYDAEEMITWRLKIDGSDLVLHVRQNNTDLSGGTEEINVSHPYEFKGTTFTPYVNQDLTNMAAGEYVYFDACGAIEADAVADRPGAAFRLTRIEPDGDDTNDDYGDEDSCSDSASDGTYTDVVLDGSLLIDESVYLCGHASQSDIQDFTLGNLTLTDTMVAMEVLHWRRANVASKTMDNWVRLLDASNTDEQQGVNLGATDFRVERKVFSLQPDASSEWSALSNVNAIKVGVRDSSSNGANHEVAAVICQVWEVDDDPETAAGAVRRRTGVGLGSVNPAMIG